MSDLQREINVLEAKAFAWKRWVCMDRRCLTCACAACVAYLTAVIVCAFLGLPWQNANFGSWVVAGSLTLSMFASWRAKRAEAEMHAAFMALCEAHGV